MNEETRAAIVGMIQGAQSSTSQAKRAELFDRYMGEPYGDEQKDRSKFVSTDVSDAVDSILPDIMDVFTATEEIVEFSPVGFEDEEAARQESQVVSHIFWQKNDGFENLYVWIKEALIQQNAYIRRGWEEKRRVEIEEYAELSAEEMLGILGGKTGEYDILEQEGGLDPETGAFTPIRIKLRCVATEKRYVIRPIPQEEFFVTPRWNRLSLDGVPCCGHRTRMSKGDLRAMGFSSESIDAANAPSEVSEQREGRFSTNDLEEFQSSVTGDKATEEVEVYEAYCRVDIDGDDVPELVRVWAIGDGSTVMKWENGEDAVEEVGSIPFSALSPYLVPHRHVGRSVAEIVDDIARVKTVLMRHSLDNIYATNFGRPYFDETQASEHTYQDLVNPAHGAPVRTGGTMINWYTPPSIVATTMPLIEGMDNLKETRTGATRYNQGLDSESLNKTATGIQKIMDAGSRKLRLIARTMAETGIRDLFLGIHRDLRAGPVKELAIKLGGKWVDVNPREWKDRTDMIVRVGMGSADRDNTRQGLMIMGQLQRELMAGGSRMASEKQVYATAQRMMATYGFKSVEPFLVDPQTMPPPQPAPPDAQTELIKAQAEVLRQESGARIMLDAQKAKWAHDAAMAELAIRHQAEQRQAATAAANIHTDGEKLDLERKKVAMQDDLARDQMKAPSAPPVGYDEL
jgi:hypothetical protein